MIAAVVIAVAVMMLSAGTISGVVEKHPTLKVLASNLTYRPGAYRVGQG